MATAADSPQAHGSDSDTDPDSEDETGAKPEDTHLQLLQEKWVSTERRVGVHGALGMSADPQSFSQGRSSSFVTDAEVDVVLGHGLAGWCDQCHV